MIYKSISYGRTKNFGNYQSERLDITIELEEVDDPVEELEKLKALVSKQLYPPGEHQTEAF
ncbi:hypothetical protein HJG54_35320 (plasmid) [Leptolyngbya sp. NK1-12]|uniref:Uncharacterized protein n=1 Tax=Leptolyngbya sp. NK1-12 TaxID=2547451 RepID=A0AA97AM07_9CYAN|nr:hypothetical protein [Leptolyngbya sp. NK1-12]WNZ28186.1 hypothetical protein HJG54_35320 [Leptolyngbya sp. NK1-12]